MFHGIHNTRFQFFKTTVLNDIRTSVIAVVHHIRNQLQ